MTEPDQAQNAMTALESGDFPRARQLFGELLDSSPDDLEFQSGFYSAGYWENRREFTARLRPGRAAGSYLVKEWEEFSRIAEDRGYSGCLSFRTAMRALLGQAADQFRLAFQEDGTLDRDVLLELGRCLIRIEDYANAADILLYARRLHSASAAVNFLLGESLCCIMSEDSKNRGLGFYRDGFLIDPAALDPTMIASHPASDVFKKLYEEKEQNLELVLDWMPSRMMIESFLPAVRKIAAQELDTVMGEIGRLERDLNRVIDKYKPRVIARLAFYYLAAMHSAVFSEKDTDMARDLEDKLMSLDPETHKLYLGRKRGGAS